MHEKARGSSGKLGRMAVYIAQSAACAPDRQSPALERCSAVRQALGGEVKAADGGGEYGRMAIRTTQASSLYSKETEHKQQVWMSHGDEAVRLPEGFTSVATSEQVSGHTPFLCSGKQEVGEPLQSGRALRGGLQPRDYERITSSLYHHASLLVSYSEEHAVHLSRQAFQQRVLSHSMSLLCLVVHAVGKNLRTHPHISAFLAGRDRGGGVRGAEALWAAVPPGGDAQRARHGHAAPLPVWHRGHPGRLEDRECAGGGDAEAEADGACPKPSSTQKSKYHFAHRQTTIVLFVVLCCTVHGLLCNSCNNRHICCCSLHLMIMCGILLSYSVCDNSAKPCSMPLQVGPEEHVICALSGGVDSTVAATLVHKVVGDRLHCVFVDNGLLRFKVGAGATPALKDAQCEGPTCSLALSLICL